MISEETKADLRAELKNIRSRLAEVEPLKKQEAAILALLGTLGESPEQPQLLKVPESRNPTRYTNMGVTEGTDAVLIDHRNGGYLSPREIMLELERGGFRNDSPHLRTMIANACSRKSKGVLSEYEEATKNGTHAYRLSGWRIAKIDQAEASKAALSKSPNSASKR